MFTVLGVDLVVDDTNPSSYPRARFYLISTNDSGRPIVSRADVNLRNVGIERPDATTGSGNIREPYIWLANVADASTESAPTPPAA